LGRGAEDLFEQEEGGRKAGGLKEKQSLFFLRYLPFLLFKFFIGKLGALCGEGLF
jgi:hypothetical protein